MASGLSAGQPLSPWPSTRGSSATRSAAAQRLAPLIGLQPLDERTFSLGELAAARVEKTAPGAPQWVKDEAVIRYAGYLAMSDFGTIQSEEIGPRKVTYTTNHANAWRSCGAYGLLSPWAIRNAGVIG